MNLTSGKGKIEIFKDRGKCFRLASYTIKALMDITRYCLEAARSFSNEEQSTFTSVPHVEFTNEMAKYLSPLVISSLKGTPLKSHHDSTSHESQSSNAYRAIDDLRALPSSLENFEDILDFIWSRMVRIAHTHTHTHNCYPQITILFLSLVYSN